MKPFNLEEAKAGKPICTRDGHKARIICFDRKSNIYPIVALIEDNFGEYTKAYTIEGRDGAPADSEYLFMVADEEPKCPFKPFDKVIVRDDYDDCSWCCALFSNMDEVDGDIYFYCHGFAYDQCIPYNEETEHLVGTTDDAPEKYVIW